MIPLKQLKVLIDARMIHQGLHGIARYTADLIHGLNELGQRVSLILNNREDVEKLGPTSVQNIHICKAPFASLTESFALSKIQDLEPYDILHFPSFAVPLQAPWSKVVITIHDLIHLHGSIKPFHQIYYRTILAPAAQKAKTVIAVSEGTRNELHQILKLPTHKISVVRNGLEPHWFLSQLFSETEIPQFIALGNLKEHKNMITLIKACRQLWSEKIAFNLLLSLGGQELPSNWNLTAEEKSKIKILKNVTDQELKKHILQSRALVSTSIIEGYNYPLAEALVLHKPVILSRIPVHSEFKADQLHFYGEPLDLSGLIVEMKKMLHKSEESGNFHHNVISRKEMAQKTLEAYLK